MNESQVFTNALKFASPAERAAYLDRACAGNRQLRAGVEALLRAQASDPDFLEQPPGSATDTADVLAAAGSATTTREPVATDQPGIVLSGRYKLVEQIGEGGMGTVWMAQQTEPVKRHVAVKLIKDGMGSKSVLARFEAERQALALMDHPNIAKVFDAGAAPDGRPFFVMELVKGVPITKYCDEHRLTPRQRLELFLPVCHAVQHAHQKGVIHRDLKPSNVLVALYDDRPVPKVIDFGVAKATGQPLTEESLHTSFGAVVGTVEYMSPEQATFNQLDVDTRSDIYSLGVLLYELLTGTTPLDRKRLKETPLLELLRIVREDDTVRPSTRLSTVEGLPAIAAKRGVEPKKLSGLVRGELDWIVMKALEKDRARRYETANGFAMDVQRYLTDEPVQACSPSRGYRLRKFVRRNKGPVLAASLVVLALVGGVIGTTWGLVRAEHARQGEQEQRLAAEANAKRAVEAQERAEQGFAKAKEAVEQYLKAVADDPDLKHKQDLRALRKKLLGAAVPFYQWFTEQKPGEAVLEAERGRAHGRLGGVRYELGETEAARTDYERMEAIFAQLAADFRAVPEYRRELAVSHHDLGNLLKDLGQRPAAEQAYRRALDLWEKLAAEFPDVPAHRRDLARGHNSLGILLQELGQRPAAERAYRRALDLREKLAADLPDKPAYREELARSHNNLGILLQELGQRPAAERAYRRALDLREKLAADLPDVPGYRHDLARGHNSLGNLLKDLGQRPAAERAYRRALDLWEKLAAEFPAVPGYRRELARGHNSLGLLLADLGQRPAAEQAFRRALDLREKLAAEFPDLPAHRRELGESHNSLGLLLAELGQRPAAERAYRRALDLWEKLAAEFPDVPRYRHDLAASSVNFGNLLRDHGQAEASLAWFAKAITLLEPLVQQEPRLVTERLFLRNAHWARAGTLDMLGRHADAIKDWDRALALSPDPARERDMRLGRAVSLARAGEHAKAVAEADTLAAAKDVDSASLYNLACVYAVASVVVKDANTPGAGATRLAETYPARAVELLRQAVAKGYKDAAHMKTDKDLDALRDREDFKRLVAELEAKKE